MEYIKKENVQDQLVLEPEDWGEDEWLTILKLFGMKEAERIVISNYTFEAYGEKSAEPSLTEEDWNNAISYLDTLIVMYAQIGWPGQFGLQGVLVPLKNRYEKGERTEKLYDEIMACE